MCDAALSTWASEKMALLTTFVEYYLLQDDIKNFPKISTREHFEQAFNEWLNRMYPGRVNSASAPVTEDFNTVVNEWLDKEYSTE
jgi:hypothetical protein